jgi:hypothetical protein
LGTTSTAPLRSASRAFAEPLSATELMTMTGFGRYCMMRRRKVRPSMRGISISRVMTIGGCADNLDAFGLGQGIAEHPTDDG